MIHSELPVPTGSLWWMELNAILRLARSAPPAGGHWQLVVDGAQSCLPTCQFTPSSWVAQQLLASSLLESSNCWELGGEQVVQPTGG